MLTTKVGSIELTTPLILASGYITETPEFFLRAHPHGCAGIVTRSLKEHVPADRENIPVPRYAVFQSKSMLNCEWGNERPWTEWRDTGVTAIRETGSPIIVSLSGRDPQSCANLMRTFDQQKVNAYEVNVSCSHSGALHGNLNVDVEHLRNLMGIIRPVTSTPIWIKLSYSTQLVQMALIAEELGADAIVSTNSIGPGMLIDTHSARPEVGIAGGGGGLTGEAIFPIALWCVHQLANKLSIPVVGVGGIGTADEAIQMLMAGASALQLYTTPALRGPQVFARIQQGITRFLVENPRYGSVSGLIGITKQYTKEHRYSSPKPRVIAEKCTGCTLCVAACAFDALSMVERPGERALAVIADNCISCNACVGACPPRFDAITVSFEDDSHG